MQLVPQIFPVGPSLVKGTPITVPVPGLFKAQLAARFATIVASQIALFAGKAPAVQTTSVTPAASNPLDVKLAALISVRMKNGESLGDIVASLSKSLASSVANGGAGPDVQKQLQKVFAAALSPPGTAPPSADANGALSLAHRFRQLAEIATRVADPTQTGQPNRFLGPDLDAKAKVDLAPAETKNRSEAVTSGFVSLSVDSIVLAATFALGRPPAPASVATDDTAVPVAPANGSAPILESTPTIPSGTLESSRGAAVDPNASANTPAIVQTAAALANAIEAQFAAATAPATIPTTLAAPIAALLATDGRIVTSSGPKTGTSGDTQLGRILTRAINVASAIAPVPAVPSAIAPAPAVPSAIAPAPAVPSAIAPAPAVPSTNNRSNTSTGGDLSSFLSAFASAVAKADGSQNASFPSGTPANDFLATLDAANAVSIATSLPAAPAPTVGIANTNGPAPIAFDASLFATPPSYAPQSADRYAVVEQVLKGISVRNLGGVSNSEVRLRLVPEHLGDVNVKLVVTNGGVNATVVAANSDVRDTLIANQQQLARSLESAGLKLTGFSVDVSNGGFAGFQHQQQQPSATRGAVASEFDDSDVQADLAIAATPSFAPPQAADVRLGHLNALV